MRTPYKKQDGFTLLEAVIAIGILTIGILGLLPMLITSMQGNSKASSMTEASALVQSRIEQLLACPRNDDMLKDGVPVLNFIGAYGAQTADKKATEGRYTLYWDSTPVMDASTPPRQVGVSLRIDAVWEEKGRIKQVTMFTQRTI